MSVKASSGGRGLYLYRLLGHQDVSQLKAADLDIVFERISRPLGGSALLLLTDIPVGCLLEAGRRMSPAPSPRHGQCLQTWKHSLPASMLPNFYPFETASWLSFVVHRRGIAP